MFGSFCAGSARAFFAHVRTYESCTAHARSRRSPPCRRGPPALRMASRTHETAPCGARSLLDWPARTHGLQRHQSQQPQAHHVPVQFHLGPLRGVASHLVVLQRPFERAVHHFDSPPPAIQLRHLRISKRLDPSHAGQEVHSLAAVLDLHHPQHQRPSPTVHSLDPLELAEVVAQIYGVTSAEVLKRRSRCREACRLVMYLAARYCRHRHSLCELARLLSVTVGGLSTAWARVTRELTSRSGARLQGRADQALSVIRSGSSGSGGSLRQLTTKV